jgi:hypothetical protein
VSQENATLKGAGFASCDINFDESTLFESLGLVLNLLQAIQVLT